MSRKFVPLVACAALALGACGGDDDDEPASSGDPGATATTAAPAPAPAPPPAADRLTRAQWAQRASRICRDTEERQQDYEDRVERIDENDLPARAEIVADALAITREEFDRLKALRPPASTQRLVDDYVTAVELLLETRNDLVQAARDNDRDAGRGASEESERLDDDADRLASRLGLDDCDDTF